MRKEVRFVGIGGQGIVWMATLMGVAASLDKGLIGSVSARHGAQVRGGFSKADCVLSDDPISFPWATALDALAVLDSRPVSKYDLKLLRPEGFVLLESTLPELAAQRLERIPAFEASKKTFGSNRFANVITLGRLASILGIPSLDSLKKGIMERAGRSSLESNLKAIELGFEMGRKT